MLRLILVFLAAVPVFAVPQHDATDRESRTGDRIIGGVPATIEEFPFLVGVYHTWENETFSYSAFRCGGTIITEDWLLTAAHCVDPKRQTYSAIDLRAGSSYRNRGGIMRRVIERVLHDYPPHDIALIKVDEPWPFDGNTIYLARLPRRGDPIPVHGRATIMGWGFTDLQGPYAERLMKQEVLVVSLEYCRATYSFWTEQDITEEIMCTSFDPQKTPSSAFKEAGGASFIRQQYFDKGDSGSPVVVDGEVVGIVSWGAKKTLYFPNVHTRVSSYIDWIEEHVGALPRDK